MLYQHVARPNETWDLDPAPSEIRSQFSSIRTNVSIDICEHFPRQLAEIADMLIRSMHHDVGIHSDGRIIALTGKRPVKLDPASSLRVTILILVMLPVACWDYPVFASLCYDAAASLRGQPTYLGLHHDPFRLVIHRERFRSDN